MSKFLSKINVNDEFSLPIVSGSDGQVLAATSTTDTEWVDSEWVTDGDDIYNNNSGNVGIGTD